ncbi:MAG: class I SAM-dependent methyltransferase [Methanomassiliicoccales archaeon]|nr:class I SAM-dependent methyltransferase [Methanomassiliicoccales archaeon]
MNHEQQRLWDEYYHTSARAWKGFEELPLKLSGDERILELGCGDGKTMSAFESIGNIGVGVDFSLAALRSCKKRFFGNENLHFVHADAANLPFRNQSFDIVIAYHLFEHLDAESRIAVVSEARRVLVDGGLFLIRVFSIEDMRYGAGRCVGNNTFQRGTGIILHYFDEGEILRLLEGMTIRSISRIDRSKRYGATNLKRSYIEAIAKKID